MMREEDEFGRIRIYLVHQPSQFLMLVYVESPRSNQNSVEV